MAVTLAAPAVAAAAAAGGKAAADRQAVERARQHIVKGEAAFRAGRYPEAMAEFEAGHRLVPRPGFLLNMGHVQRRMGNLPRARDFFRRYLDSAPGSKRRGEVEALIAEIDAASSAAQHPKAGAPTAPPPVSSPPPSLALASASDDEVPAGLNLTSRELAAAPPEPQRPYHRRWWFWGAVAGVLAGGGVAVFLATRSSEAGYVDSGSWGALGR
jgi:tetratricopeptide (TPR) repeat protein